VLAICQTSGPAADDIGPAAPVAQGELRDLRAGAVPVQDYRLSGPHTSGNLTLFLVHGADALRGRSPLTLQEALERGQATVHETGMAQLSVQNRSGSDLFIQSGDIVKGGTQDRVLQYDQVIPSGDDLVSVTSFCVEQGRSGPRGLEPAMAFSSATEQLPG